MLYTLATPWQGRFCCQHFSPIRIISLEAMLRRGRSKPSENPQHPPAEPPAEAQLKQVMPDLGRSTRESGRCFEYIFWKFWYRHWIDVYLPCKHFAGRPDGRMKPIKFTLTESVKHARRAIKVGLFKVNFSPYPRLLIRRLSGAIQRRY